MIPKRTMKFSTIFHLFIFALLCHSCIKKEAPDREADVESFTLNNPEFLTSIINNRTHTISVVVSDTTSYENCEIAPIIKISDNAIIQPASNEIIKLTNYQYIYKVISQFGESRHYMVSIVPYIPLIQNFNEYITVNPNSTKPYQIPSDPMWSNANAGVTMLYKPEQLPMPTRYSYESEDQRPGRNEDGVVILETKMGSRNDINKPMVLDILDVPVYAGSMFRGEFDVSQAMKDPLKTTKFGQPYPSYLGKPSFLHIWYKYESGDNYISWEYSTTGKLQKQVKIHEKRERLDIPDLYAVLFKVEKGEAGRREFLDGYNINKFKENQSIVAYASLVDRDELKDSYETDWSEKKIKFIYKEEPDFDSYDYKLAVVLSSSYEGASYKGAIGSKLALDYLRIVCEKDEDINSFN